MVTRILFVEQPVRKCESIINNKDSRGGRGSPQCAAAMFGFSGQHTRKVPVVSAFASYLIQTREQGCPIIRGALTCSPLLFFRALFGLRTFCCTKSCKKTYVLQKQVMRRADISSKESNNQQPPF